MLYAERDPAGHHLSRRTFEILRTTRNVGTCKSQRHEKVSHEANTVAGLSSVAVSPPISSTDVALGSETSRRGLFASTQIPSHET